MAYEFRSALDVSVYRTFAQSLPHCNFMQMPMWANVKTGWHASYCGLFDGDTMVAGAQLLMRTLFAGQKILYAPRGFLLDFSDDEKVAAFTDGVRAYAKKIGAYMVRLDPEILLSTLYRGEKTEYPSGKSCLDRLCAAGYRHMGFATDFHTYTQPRFNAEYALTDGGVPKTDDEMLADFDKKLRKFIGKYTAARGISFTHGNSDASIALFSALSKHTEERQHILLRDEAYFVRMRDAFGDHCMFFFAQMRISEFLAYLDTQPDEEQTRCDREDALALQRQYGDTVPMSALCMIRSADTAYLLYSGFDDSIFPRFRTTNQLRWEAMRYFRDQGCSTFSFMGIHGDLTDSLSDFKLKFNPHVVEYIGELELPVKPRMYAFMRRFLPFAKRIYINIALFFKGKK